MKTNDVVKDNNIEEIISDLIKLCIEISFGNTIPVDYANTINSVISIIENKQKEKQCPYYYNNNCTKLGIKVGD